ncbi:acyl-CoA N-acyltransferase, partial [Staphylotrichum tortipilum]
PTTIIPLSTTLLRPLIPSDAPSLQLAADSPAIAQHMSYQFPSPYTLADAHKWIAIATALTVPGTTLRPSFGICDAATGAVLGGVGVKPRADVEERTFEVGYWLAEGKWGQGLMTEVLGAYVDWFFGAVPTAVRLEGVVFGGNEASGRVLEKVGFVYEGTRRKAGTKNGRVFDILVYGLLREEWGAKKE